jgi:hypothetical protein
LRAGALYKYPFVMLDPGICEIDNGSEYQQRLERTRTDDRLLVPCSELYGERHAQPRRAAGYLQVWQLWANFLLNSAAADCAEDFLIAP